MRASTGTVLVGLVVALILVSLSLFVVDQRQNVMVFRLGEVVGVETKPGLYFKVPLLDNVRYFDTRILTIDTAEPEHFLTSEKKNVLVDLFVKWRIEDVSQYYGSIIVGELVRSSPPNPPGFARPKSPTVTPPSAGRLMAEFLSSTPVPTAAAKSMRPAMLSQNARRCPCGAQLVE